MRIHIFKGGHTLSAGQTGNIIFFSSSLANHNIPGMINRASTFIVGLLVVGLFHKYVKGYYWRVFCLFPILAICLIVVFLPRSVPNYYIVPVIAFGLAIQNASFSKIEGMGYNNAFTTGNLKRSVVAWSAFFFGEDKSQHTAAVNYMLLVISFGIGAIVSAFLQKFLILKTLWIAVILLLAIINMIYLNALKNALKNNKKIELLK
ncbi:Integral membrane protein [Lactobacillus helveticus CIRM-BIA 951]|uniref:Integral membrane protein n=1 Tax=Lactobacillus helveticus CIRM-BIA 951 TaxID=1226334 RepID=U6F3G4_LACHE|nr:Integral membrane protein [Lactobacillus helveticus CIRM-BIA 951]